MGAESYDNSVTIAVVLAVVVMLLILFVWPGVVRVRAGELAGYWAARDGKMYSIIPTAEGEGFEIRGANPFSQTASTGLSRGRLAGRVEGVRGLRVDAADAPRGRLALGGRRIEWADGGVWTRQGAGTTRTYSRSRAAPKQ
jgi:hypothetical protein